MYMLGVHVVSFDCGCGPKWDLGMDTTTTCGLPQLVHVICYWWSRESLLLGKGIFSCCSKDTTATQKGNPQKEPCPCIGVLFGWFAYKIEGSCLPGGSIIYQGHLFSEKDTHGNPPVGQRICKLFPAVGGKGNPSLLEMCLLEGPSENGREVENMSAMCETISWN